jgi:hypothetical protein
VTFRLGLWRCTSIWVLRATCFSPSLVYAATHWVLAANYARAAIVIAAILLGVLLDGVRMLRRIWPELPVLEGETPIPTAAAAPAAE